MNAYLLPTELQEKITDFLPLKFQLVLSKYSVKNNKSLNWDCEEVNLLDEEALLKYIKFLLLKNIEIKAAKILEIAVRKGYCKVVKYLSKLKNIYYEVNLMSIAIKSGNLDILELLDNLIDDSHFVYDMRNIVFSKNIDIVKYMFYNKKTHCDIFVVEYAQLLNCSEILEFLHSKYPKYK